MSIPTLKQVVLFGLKKFDRHACIFPRCGSFAPIRGSFSAFEAVQAGRLEGCVLCHSQPIGECPHGSVTELAGMQQHDHQPWPVFWARTSDARLVGRMLHWRDPGDRLCLEGVFHICERRRLREDRLLAQVWVSKPVMLEGAWISLASNWGCGGNYFHWLLDCLTRLRVRESLPEPTRILLPPIQPNFVKETIAMLGLEEQVMAPPASCIQPERYYFCSPTSMTGVWNPMGYSWLRQAFSRFLASPRSGPPIFLTRRGGSRVPANIAEIEAIFTRYGFQIVDCGAIPVAEQIRSASGAAAIAGLHGAAMTNLLWGHAGVPVMEIFQSSYVNACYEQIAFHGKLRYQHHILGTGRDASSLDRWCKSIGQEP